MYIGDESNTTGTTSNILTYASNCGHFQLAKWIESYQSWSKSSASVSFKMDHSQKNLGDVNSCAESRHHGMLLPHNISLPPHEVLYKLQARQDDDLQSVKHISKNTIFFNTVPPQDSTSKVSPSLFAVSHRIQESLVGQATSSLSLALKAKEPWSLCSQTTRLKQENISHINRKAPCNGTSESNIQSIQSFGSLLPSFKLWPKNKTKQCIIFVLLLCNKISSIDRDMTSVFISHVLPFLLCRGD